MNADLTTVHLGPLTADAIPEAGNTVLATTDRDFSAWDWVPALLRAGRGRIDRLILSTFNLGTGVITSLDDLLGTEQVAVAALVLSAELDHLGDAGKTYDALTCLALEHRGRFRWVAKHSHAKVVCAYMASGEAFTVIGSGNLSTHNTRYESYVVLNSRVAADHMARWIGVLLQ